ncbi:glycoside hydrolase N-terminal domain-containing protein [Nonomuraea jabiensis]|uniref:glycoside hydrolase N-terminal domain-containing protein n=1 Tax=Nonomuraea jabiensis TaxID=882448 RepID=UPI003D7166A2
MLLPWTAAARTASAAPAEVRAANDLALWYDESAGTEWLRALPIGNGRLGTMVFGNVDTERLQLNEDTIWAGGPYDQSNTKGAAALGQRPISPSAICGSASAAPLALDHHGRVMSPAGRRKA